MKKTIYTIIFLLLGVCEFSTAQTNIVINEASNRNFTQVEYETDNWYDWIELYNKGNSALLLGNLYLSDDSTDLQKWQIPNYVMPPQSHRIFFADGLDIKVTDNISHTNFKIDREGETIFLSDNNGNIIDKIWVNLRELNHSVGSVTDGATARGIFTNATPNASNNDATAYTEGAMLSPTYNRAPGFYEYPIYLNLDNIDNSNATIRYTTNGDEVTETSNIYTNPLYIQETQVIKARTFGDAAKLPSKSVTLNYIIQQKHKVPVITLTTDNNNLYGGFGIYDNWSTDWKRPCYVEYYDSSGVRQWWQNTGIKIDGGAGGSRSNPQKSFRLETNHGTFGEGVLDFPLIPQRNTDNTKYESIYLRNGSNQWLYLPYKDAYQVSTFEGTFNNYQAYTPCVVYLNGQYWGVYEIREKQDKGYFKNVYDCNTDSLEILSMSYFYNSELRAVEGSTAGFLTAIDYINTLDPTTNNFVAEVDKRFDVQYYTDYIIAETWWGNYDWPQNNIKIWRADKTDNKFRFGLIDLELSQQPNGWSDINSNFMDHITNFDAANPYIHLWQLLSQNNAYNRYFINRYADLMNTTLLPAKMLPREESMFLEIVPEMPDAHRRWKDTIAYPVDNFINDFFNAHTTFRNEFIQRSPKVREHIIGRFGLVNEKTVILDVYPEGAGKVKISTVTPDEYPWSGIYFNGNPVKVEAIANEGYIFQKWEPNAVLSNIFNPIFDGNIPQNMTFKAIFEDDTSANNILSNEVALAVFPTPTVNELIIAFENILPNEKIQLALYDTNGRLLKTKQTDALMGYNRVTWNIADVAVGCYSLQVTSGTKHWTKKVVVVR